MTQSSTHPSGRFNRVAYRTINEACDGDIEAMTLIQQHFDSYIQKLATIEANGTQYLDVDLYDRLKTRLILCTMKFRM